MERVSWNVYLGGIYSHKIVIMLISWINRFSLIDYPWQISCIVFTPWCNFRCNFCHNPEFVLPERLNDISKYIIKEKQFLNFLDDRKWLLTWVSICWWEPTLQTDLLDFCRKVKEKWFLVKLDTNWRDPDLISELIEKKLVDYVAMDIKHSIGKFWVVAWVDVEEPLYLKSIKILLNSDIDYEFRTTVIKWYHTKKDIENISKYISWSKAYYLQNFKSKWILNEKFDWKSFKVMELKELKQIAEKYIKNVWIRN